jgi:hypothetical protein
MESDWVCFALLQRYKLRGWPKRCRRVCIANRNLGWLVRYSVESVTVQKFFSDKVHGTSASARAAAERFAHANIDLHLELLALRRRLLLRKNCRSGIPGVSRYEVAGRGPFWVAYWDDAAGKKRQRKFSVKSFGEIEARNQALVCRARAVAQYLARWRKVKRLLERKTKARRA